ncbi:gamma-glutamylcyclotransferase [Streptomyces tricolor]|nr:gamma-glutamylcyclotransferase [Streptomyces tricolor]
MCEAARVQNRFRDRRGPRPLPFFVYGIAPSRRGQPRPLPARSHLPRNRGTPPASLYDGPGYPYAVEEPGGPGAANSSPPGREAYEDLLAALDRLEEYVPGDPRNLYERAARDVVRTGGGTVRPGPPRRPARRRPVWRHRHPRTARRLALRR